MKVSSNCHQCGKMIGPWDFLCETCKRIEKEHEEENALKNQEIKALKLENEELKRKLAKLGKGNE